MREVTITPAQGKLLAEALGKCLVASGIVRPDISMTGPELLMFSEDLGRLLAEREEVTLSEDLPQDVINLVIAAREFWDDHYSDLPSSHALDEALKAFSKCVLYENEPEATRPTGCSDDRS